MIIELVQYFLFHMQILRRRSVTENCSTVAEILFFFDRYPFKFIRKVICSCCITAEWFCFDGAVFIKHKLLFNASHLTNGLYSIALHFRTILLICINKSNWFYFGLLDVF